MNRRGAALMFTVSRTSSVFRFWLASISQTSPWLTVSGDRVFYDAYSSTAGRELWTSDGTAGGTAMVKDIIPGGQRQIQSVTAAGEGTVYFTASDGTPAPLPCRRSSTAPCR